MILLLKIEINVIAAIILILLLFNMRSSRTMMDEKLFAKILLSTLIFLVTDMCAYISDRQSFCYAHVLNYLSNFVYFFLSVFIPYLWLTYVNYKLYSNDEQIRKRITIFSIPLIVFIVVLLSNPITSLIFDIAAGNTYVRGSLHAFQTGMALLYLLTASGIALYKSRHLELGSQKHQCYLLAAFPIFPFIGTLIQAMFGQLPVVLISTILALLTIFINVQNQQISLDPLTGLNNRGQMNRYLASKTTNPHPIHRLYMILIDIDKFKSINDTFGHNVGDLALISTADVLRHTCRNRRCFIARYGGDEFCIIKETSDENDVKALISDIEDEIAHFNDTTDTVYKLSLSLGYAVFGEKNTSTVDKLLEAADQKMYEQKVKKKATR